MAKVELRGGPRPTPRIGFFVGHCDAYDFDILADWTGSFTFVDLYDKYGMWVRSVAHDRVLGRGLYYNSAEPWKSILGGPGEGVNVRWDAAAGLRYGSGMSWKVKGPASISLFAQMSFGVLKILLIPFAAGGTPHPFPDVIVVF